MGRTCLRHYSLLRQTASGHFSSFSSLALLPGDNALSEAQQVRARFLRKALPRMAVGSRLVIAVRSFYSTEHDGHQEDCFRAKSVEVHAQDYGCLCKHDERALDRERPFAQGSRLVRR